MRNLLITISMCILLVSCGDDKMQKTGLFSGTVGKKDYKIEVACFKNKHNNITFLSDENETDENGDGIVISGFVLNGEFSVDIKDNGKRYTDPNLTEFLREEKKVEGSGTIDEYKADDYLSGYMKTHNFKFTLTCKSYI